jgi:hypothetical protein
VVGREVLQNEAAVFGFFHNSRANFFIAGDDDEVILVSNPLEGLTSVPGEVASAGPTWEEGLNTVSEGGVSVIDNFGDSPRGRAPFGFDIHPGIVVMIVGRVSWWAVATSEVATEFKVPFKLRESDVLVFWEIGSRVGVSGGGDEFKADA